MHNALFGNLHLNWTGTGTSWFCYWCWKHELPYPFIGWVNADKFGDQCILGRIILILAWLVHGVARSRRSSLRSQNSGASLLRTIG